jgi:hypothetical protein
MCSGCFGEYEENEDFNYPTPELGPEHAELQGDSCDETYRRGRRIFDEDEFEVLVGAERIVEIRWISAGPLGSSTFTAPNRTVGQAPGCSAEQHSQGASAKNYQTLFSAQYFAEGLARGSSKYCVFTTLTLFSLGALAFWLLWT